MWIVLNLLALLNPFGDRVPVQSSLTAVATVIKVDACLEDETTGYATVALEISVANGSSSDVVALWDFTPAEIYAARNQNEAVANRWLWSMPFDALVLTGSGGSKQRLGPSSTKKLIRNITFPISAQGTHEVGFLPAGSDYFFTLTFQEDGNGQVEEISSVNFVATVPPMRSGCKR